VFSLTADSPMHFSNISGFTFVVSTIFGELIEGCFGVRVCFFEACVVSWRRSRGLKDLGSLLWNTLVGGGACWKKLGWDGI